MRLTVAGPAAHVSSTGTRRLFLVAFYGGKPQAFYQSSGHSSGKPGVWFPFDGLDERCWFRKTRFTHPRVSRELHRFGTETLRRVSRKLAGVEIEPPAVELREASEVNAQLRRWGYQCA